jgi:aspartate kinase
VPPSIDSVSVIIEDDKLGGLDDVLLEQISRQLDPDSISIEKDLALVVVVVVVVGEGMVRTVGISCKIFRALGRANVNVRVINQGASEMNIIIGVSGADYETTVWTI